MPLRLVAAIALAFAPIFCANLDLRARFADTAGSTAAFGGEPARRDARRHLEYASLIIGYRALISSAAARSTCSRSR